MKGEIKRFLRELGIDPRRMGYYYIIFILGRLLEKKGGEKAFFKAMYEECAIEFGTSAENAEKNIANAVKAAWRRSEGHGRNVKKAVFGTAGAPTNGDFFIRAAEYLREGEN